MVKASDKATSSLLATIEHPHSPASASSAAGLQRARAVGIELARAADLERARAATREGARRLPGSLKKQIHSARRQRRLAQAIRMSYAAAMATIEATRGTHCQVFRFSTAADETVSADKAANAFERTATDGCLTDEDVQCKEAKVEAKV